MGPPMPMVSAISSTTGTSSPAKETSPSTTYFLGWTSKTHKKAKSCPDDLIPPQKILRVRQENSPVVLTMSLLNLDTPQLLYGRIFQRLNIADDWHNYLIYACRQGSSVGKPIDEQELFELCQEAEATDPIELVVCHSDAVVPDHYNVQHHSNDARYLFQTHQTEPIYLSRGVYEDPQEIPRDTEAQQLDYEQLRQGSYEEQSYSDAENISPLVTTGPSRQNSTKPKLRRRASSYESLHQVAKP
ncbi:hypothetical protein K7432_018566, partial [Basidiobolus ranarum]